MSNSQATSTAPRLRIRKAELSDLESIRQLVDRAYPGMKGYSSNQLRSHQVNFPEGQFVAVYEGDIVGYCATFCTSKQTALSPHTWGEITANGYLSRHEETGEYLYGAEVCVDPTCRRLRIGQRLYNARKELCRKLQLKGIVFGGRLPGYSKKAKKFPSVDKYVESVEAGDLKDSVLSFQLRNGFKLLGVLPDYLPSDTASAGFAAHLVWENPEVENTERQQASWNYHPRKVRIAVVQYKQRRITSFEQFMSNVEYFVDTVSDYRSDFVVFPELFTLQLLSLEQHKLSPAQAIAALTEYTERFREAMGQLAVRYNINIIGGSHPTRVRSGDILNISYVFLRDGSIHEQPKIHPTPNERYWWNIKGADSLSTILTDCGPIGVLICYDSEFPELARYLINQGAKIIFVPFCTDEKKSYLRVRYCSQARAVENQCYVAMAGNVGNLPNVENMDIQYAQSCILTPCDFPFARDGIAADTTPNVEMVAFADLDLNSLVEARNNGTVLNLKDRRFDLYSVDWKK